jgi:hypothetical protein
MRTYGQTKKAISWEDYATDQTGWKGRQSRKVARRRAKDTKALHRLARRRARQELRTSQEG